MNAQLTLDQALAEQRRAELIEVRAEYKRHYGREPRKITEALIQATTRALEAGR